MDALVLAGMIAMTAVLIVWALWLADREGASRLWKLLMIAVPPCVAIPAALAVFTDPALTDVAHGVLFTFAVLVSIGTLMHAGRAQHS